MFNRYRLDLLHATGSQLRLASEDILPYLLAEFKDAFVEARGNHGFHRTGLRDKESELLREWRGLSISLADQIPLAARETTFMLALFFMVKLAQIQRSKDPSAKATRAASLIGMLGGPGTGKLTLCMCKCHSWNPFSPLVKHNIWTCEEQNIA